jgi:DNA invertase Pin-like site-specific DNA recombinase
MHGSIKIQTTHLSRQGIVYLRQSDPKQVRENRESAINQRALKERLLELGWKPGQVEVVDGDQGISARHAQGRESFQKLVADVGLGKIGIIVGYEVSRLARNCADWHRLLELCGLSDTLIGDSDGIYSPTDFNDRLLLGLKGTMSEAELHSIRLRLNAGRMSKARRGELVHHLPTGYIRNEIGEVTFDPDQSVVSRIELVFSKFDELGSGYQVLRHLAEHELKLPRRQTSGLYAHQTLWKLPTLSAIHSILKNPAYSGAFAYGRRQAVASKQVPGRPAAGRVRQEQDNWLALVKDVYPAYVSWEQWEKIQSKMAENHQTMQTRLGKKNSGRSGAALLAGLVRCGKCGRSMRVIYKDQRFQYSCSKSQNELRQGSCQYISGKRIDEAVVTAFMEAINPAEIDALQHAASKHAATHAEQLKHLRQDVQRLSYAAARAERQYNLVDPENRLIAGTLERKWEQALEELEQSRQKLLELEAGPSEVPKVSTADRKRFANVGKELPGLWEKLANETRKSLLRTLVSDVHLDRNDEGIVTLRIVWKGGQVTELQRQVPIHSRRYSSLEEQVVARVRELNELGTPGDQIIACLNEEGFVPCRGGKFTPAILMKLKHRYAIKSKLELLRQGDRPSNKYTSEEIASEIGVKRAWIYRKISRGEIRIKKDSTYGVYLFPRTKRAVQELRRLKEGKRAHVSFQ